MSTPTSHNNGNYNDSISTYTLSKLIGILGISMPFILLIFHPLLLSYNMRPIGNNDPYRMYHGREMVVSTSQDFITNAGKLADSTLETIPTQLTSISNYHGFYMRDFFVAILCILAAFLFTYLGDGSVEFWLSNLCAVLSIGTAFIPCHVEHYSMLHYISAAGLFFIFMVFCLFIFTKRTPRIQNTEDPNYYINKAQRRTYRICGFVILICLLICLFVFFQDERSWYHTSALVFWVETVMLMAFGTSWLTRGETMKERIGNLFVPERLKNKIHL